MPPALAAELEHVAEQLARLCGELRVDDSLYGDEVDDSRSDSDAGSSVCETHDGCESLVTSLAAASSECEALVERLEDQCDEACSWSMASEGDESGNEDQEVVEEFNCSDSSTGRTRQSDSGGVDPVCCLVDELDEFAGELKALSSRLAGLRNGCQDIDLVCGDSEDSKGDTGEKSSFDSDSDCDPRREVGEDHRDQNLGVTPQHQTDIPNITAEDSPDTVEAKAAGAPQQAQTVKMQERKAPSPPKHRIRRRSVGSSLRLRIRKRASAHTKKAKRTVGACVPSMDEAACSAFQRKSFAQHVSRQQLARLRIDEKQAAEKRLAAARFQHSATLSRHQASKQRSKGARHEAALTVHQPVSKFTDRSYLERFVDSLGPREIVADPGGADAADEIVMARVLCGVYVYGRRADGVVYMTFASMEQLRKRIVSHLGVSQFVNLYRERRMRSVGPPIGCPLMISDASNLQTRTKKAQSTRLLQRVSSFDQIADGDMLCVTRDAYEDMTILCEWVAYRRQRPSVTGAGSAQAGSGYSATETMEETRHERVPSNAVPALRSLIEGDTARANRPKSSIPPLWDRNGRSIRVGNAVYHVHPSPKASTIASDRQDRSRK